jgi:pimeloyl-ACP methyl ester carboxylesterase
MEHVGSADGTPIAFERLGSGPSVVLVHSGFVDRRIWLPVAPILAERFTVILTDRRGRGESGPNRRDHAIEREFEDVAAVVRGLEPPVTLVGHSSSAWYVLYGAGLAGGVHRLVL